MTSGRRARARRVARATNKLERTVVQRTQSRTPTEHFGYRLDEMAAANGQRIRIARVFPLFGKRVVVVYKRERHQS